MTPRPQPGNSGQRLYRLAEDEAVINRFGFNSRGIAPFAANLARRRGRPGIVGANVGKNRDTTDGAADYIACIEAVGALADYLVVNVSSPNTPGLRALQARAQIEELLARVQRRRGVADAAGVLPPLLVKVGPDLDDGRGARHRRGGARDRRRRPHHRQHHRGAAADIEEPRPQRAGRPVGQAAARAFDRVPRRDVPLHPRAGFPIIGCGGIASGADAYAKIRAGASLVQLYSALVFHGPGLVGRIKRELAALLRRDGFASVRDAVGADER